LVLAALDLFSGYPEHFTLIVLKTPEVFGFFLCVYAIAVENIVHDLAGDRSLETGKNPKDWFSRVIVKDENMPRPPVVWGRRALLFFIIVVVEIILNVPTSPLATITNFVDHTTHIENVAFVAQDSTKK
jgi:hypothetical protein